MIGAGGGTMTAKGIDLQSALTSLGYRNFTIKKYKDSAVVEVPGIPGYKTTYFATLFNKGVDKKQKTSWSICEN